MDEEGHQHRHSTAAPCHIHDGVEEGEEDEERVLLAVKEGGREGGEGGGVEDGLRGLAHVGWHSQESV